MGWHPWFNVSGGRAALRSPITAIARNPNHLDLFVTGTDGRIYSTWWDVASGWANWFNVSGGRGRARLADHCDRAQSQPPGPVRHRHRRAHLLDLVGRRERMGQLVQRLRRRGRAGVARSTRSRAIPNHLDLFVTGTDGRIYSTWWDAASGWANWFNVSGGAAALGSPITAIARNPNHLDLFVTGTDGRHLLDLVGAAQRVGQLVQRLRRRGGTRFADHRGGAQSQPP